jgi:hypothetical protein
MPETSHQLGHVTPLLVKERAAELDRYDHPFATHSTTTDEWWQEPVALDVAHQLAIVFTVYSMAAAVAVEMHRKWTRHGCLL